MLEEIWKQKGVILQKERAIEELKVSSGMAKLEAEVVELKETLKGELEKAYLAGIEREGSLFLTTKTREKRTVKDVELREKMPEVFNALAHVGTTDLEAYMVEARVATGVKKTEAKEYAKKDMSEYVTIEVSMTHDVVDISGREP